MNLKNAISGLRLNPLDDDLYQGILASLDSGTIDAVAFAKLFGIFNSLRSGALKFGDLEDALATLEESEIPDFEIISQSEPPETKSEIVADSTDLDPELLAVFLEEVETHIDVLASSLGQIEASVVERLDFNSLFRAAHTIKGSAASVGLLRLAHCIHEFEDLLSSQREKVSLEANQFPAIEAFVKVLGRSLPILKRSEFDQVPYDLLSRLVTHALAVEPLSTQLQDEVTSTLSAGQPVVNDTLKINASRIASLYSDVERLQSLLTESDTVIRELANTGNLAGANKRKLEDLISSQRVSTNQMQRDLISFRLIPFRSILPRIHRVVDEYRRTSGKQLELIITGESVEIKKSMVDRLVDILLHLVKNAMDHGLESIDERTAQKKNATGRLNLSARVSNSKLLISVKDDGRGINADRVLKKAAEKGIITPTQSESFSEAQAIELLFHPGFSTAEKVTSVSGRGVGMDAVKTMVGDLSGKLVMTSKMGKGSEVELIFPADVSVEEVVLIESSLQSYAIPLMSVEAIIPLDSNDIDSISRYPFYETKSEIIPIQSINSLLGLQEAETYEGLLLISGERRAGLLVERVLRKDQVIVSPTPESYLSHQHLSGIFTTDLGGLSVILNVDELLKSSAFQFREFQHAA
ncbi:MAG: chemotaxis protein CheA [Oligoflexales bacterium]